MATTTLEAASRNSGPRRFFTAVALLAAVVVFAGFARTYYLKVAFGTPELTTLKHLHGLVMTAWIVAFLVQARLVATGRTALHRRLGILGAVLAVMVVVTGYDLATTSARAGFTPNPALPPLAFLVIPLGDMALFVLLVGAALLYRRRPAIHKRLMLVATLAMLTPAVARAAILAGLPPFPPIFLGLTDLIIVGCMVADWRINGRLHPAFVAGFAAVILSQAGRFLLAKSEAWTQFARWLVA